ncbi:MAG: tripartite tricarboxylate transporter substrate binding protein [Pseudomonadota bacterium]
MKRRTLLARAPLGALSLVLPLGARAAGPYPARPVMLIAPSGPGGGFDYVGRLMAEALTHSTGKSFYVENRTGSGTLVGTQAAALAPADGYTLLVGGLSNLVFNSALYKTLPYNPAHDFTPVALVARYPYVLVARGGLAQNTAADIIAAAKATPGSLTIATAGTGTGQHVLAAAFAKAAGIELLVVPYKSAQAAYQDLLAGRIDLFFDTLASARPQFDTKRARPVFLTSDRRSPTLPHTPSAPEAGVPSVQMGSWFGLFARSGTPAPVVAELRTRLATGLQDAGLRTRLEAAGIERMDLDTSRTRDFIQAEYQKWTAVIRQAGITAD